MHQAIGMKVQRIGHSSERSTVQRRSPFAYGMLADSVRAPVRIQTNGFPEGRRTPRGVENLSDDHIRFERGSRVRRCSVQNNCPQERKRIVIWRGNRFGRDLFFLFSL